MTEETKIKLARINGLSQELYEDLVKADIGKIMPPEDELAIHRKAIKMLFQLVASLHSDVINNIEFADYDNQIESVKAKHYFIKLLK